MFLFSQESKNDDVAGTVFVSLNEVLNGPTDWKSPRWVNIYGIPEGASTIGTFPPKKFPTIKTTPQIFLGQRKSIPTNSL
jgi:hypothetical protein